MKVLGLDTATPATAAALVELHGDPGAPDRLRAREARDDPPPGRRPRHSTLLLTLAEQVLQDTETAWPELDRIGVGVGPGTFTGLRIGVATARALAQSLDVPVVGISSLRALAEGPFVPTDRDPAVLSILDARRGEVFVAAYHRGRELLQARPVPPADLPDLLAQARDRARKTQAPGGERWLALGDGAVQWAQALVGAGAEVPEDERCHRVSAIAIARLASAATPGRREDVVPDYRRRPDAELSRER